MVFTSCQGLVHFALATSLNGYFLCPYPALGACFLPLCGSSELYCLWNLVSVSLVCIFNYVLSVPAHLGLVLPYSQPGACCHCLESRLQLWQ